MIWKDRLYWLKGEVPDADITSTVVSDSQMSSVTLEGWMREDRRLPYWVAAHQ